MIRAQTKLSLIQQEGVVDSREFLGSSGTVWSVPCDLTSRADIWTSNNDNKSLENLNRQQPSTAVQAYAFASLLSCLLCRNKERLDSYIASHFMSKCVGRCVNCKFLHIILCLSQYIILKG